ncbi:hypothetical protein ACP70R_002776 [Stipagrostis hirtigluma subsp. patula]
MDTGLGAAIWLLGKLVNKLADGMGASRDLGPNFDTLKTKLQTTKGLLEAAEGKDVTDKTGFQGLLEGLISKADEAEDALDELHYFIIKDQLDGTRNATLDLVDNIAADALHARHAVRHNAGNWFSYFSCCRAQDDDDGDAAVVVTGGNTHDTSKAMAEPDNHINGGLPFDRVAMSKKFRQLIQDLHSQCDPVCELLKITNPSTKPASTNRSPTSSIPTTDQLFGRKDIFDKTINQITNARDKGEVLSVLTIVGPGGIGKTTFTQHLYSDTRIIDNFTQRVWVCVSTNFDLPKITREILSCLTKKEESGNFDQLQQGIIKELNSKRFLIVLDDMWKVSRGDWENLVVLFKMAGTNGSMILVTTRHPQIAEMVREVTKAADSIELTSLEPDEYWELFHQCIGGTQDQRLLEIAKEIAQKLKGSPLAAKTVGPLLRRNQSWEHWDGILKNKKWLEQRGDNDIIPALRISYDNLPTFCLKKCFSYLSLFPEDHKFHSLDISYFWNAIGILDDEGQNDKIEDIGSKYLDELFNSGFLMKGHDNSFVMHDLLHDLSQIVSSKECAHIDYSNFRAHEIHTSIRHLSISMKHKYIENFEEEMSRLKSRIDIGNLRSLMIFGDYRGPSIKVLKDTFDGIKSLRVLFISMHSHDMWPDNFSKLIHLRYLKIVSKISGNGWCLPSFVSTFYHLKFLDLSMWHYSCDLPKDISRLVNLRHFVARKELHSNVPKVGQMKFLQELKEFHVKEDSSEFELGQLGKLEELRGELCIRGLENVKTSREANEAKLMAKTNLVSLGLVWDVKQLSMEDDIIENLQPHPKIRGLHIVNHGSATCPSWLQRTNISLKYLEVLHLEGVSWATLPPFGQIYYLRELKLKNIVGICQFGPDFFGGVTEESFKHLKEFEFQDMPELVEWVGGANSDLFSGLERICCVNCPKLSALPFSGCSGSSTQDNIIWFPNLQDLDIRKCPKLRLPPLPHTPKLSSFRTDHLTCSEADLFIRESGDLAVQNLRGVENLIVGDASFISFTDLKKFRGPDDGAMLHSVQSLTLCKASLSENLLSNVFTCFPTLSKFAVHESDENNEEAMLQFPPSTSLKSVHFRRCKNLILPAEEGGGFQGLLSLESAYLFDCGKLFSRWSMEEAAQSTNKPFPACLKSLRVRFEQSRLSLGLLSNLTSLTSLEIHNCNNYSVDGFNPAMTFNLKDLKVCNDRGDETEPYSIAADLFAEVARIQPMPAGSFGLVELEVDSIAAVLVDPICRHLSTTLKKLSFWCDWRMPGSFTEEQEQALQQLTSLQHLSFWACRVIRCLPQVLHRLPALRRFDITHHEIRSLPKNGLPRSLETLCFYSCCAELAKECQELSRQRPNLDVWADARE